MTQVTWANDRGGSGTATGTTSWSAASVALLSGANVLTVTARDAAGNTSTDTLTVTYNPDTTAPCVDDHRVRRAHTTFDGHGWLRLTLSGTASDDVGVTQVTWANNRGGSGTATRHDVLVGRERHACRAAYERPDRDARATRPATPAPIR